MELILIRHLPTQWNKLGIFQGSQDIPILPLSIEDIEIIQENKKIIIDFEPELILASGLMRTQQTAFEYGVTSPKIDPLLNELQFGEYEGKERNVITKVKEWTDDPRSLVLGERMVDFEKRIVQFINKYNHHARIVVFGHGSWMRGLLSIVSVGTIQKMNQVHIHNNQLIHLSLNKNLHQLEI